MDRSLLPEHQGQSCGSDNAELNSNNNSNMGGMRTLVDIMWPHEAASQVTFESITKTNQGKQKTLYKKGQITYSAKTHSLELMDEETGIVMDSLSLWDIIGCDLEFKMNGNEKDDEQNNALLVGVANEKKATRGRHEMEQLENDFLQLSSSQPPKGKSPPINSDSRDTDTDANITSTLTTSAILNIYHYPRKLPSRGVLGTLRECLFSSSEEELTESNSSSKSSSYSDYGHRFAHHYHLELMPTEDFAAVQKVLSAILDLSQISSSPNEPVSESVQPSKPKQEERYLVLINPFSGKKKGQVIYETMVQPMLEQCNGVSHDVLVTTHAGHASERMAQMIPNGERDEKDDGFNDDISKYDAIIVMGGDGILAEVLQGIERRDDSKSILLKLKFGIVGCGTSNGLAKSLTHAANEKYNDNGLESTFLICKGHSQTMDISKYQTLSSKKTYTSFLTFSWAFIADLDIESEVIRFLGVLRNDIWAVWGILKLRTYRAKFSYLPPSKQEGTRTDLSSLTSPRRMEASMMPPVDQDTVPSDWITIEDDFILFWASHVTHAATNTFHSPSSTLQDGVFQIFIIRKPCSRLALLPILLGMEHGTHFESSEHAELISCVAYRLDPADSKASYNDLDGEVVESGRIQAYVVPSAMNIFCPARR